MATNSPSPGPLSGLSNNAQLLVQTGALGLLALFVWFGFTFTVDQVKSNREEAAAWRAVLEGHIKADMERYEKTREIVRELQQKLTSNQELILGNQKRILESAEAIRLLAAELKTVKKKSGWEEP